MARKPDRNNVRQKIDQLDEWIRSGSAARDIEEAVRDGVERASRYVPPEALRRLGGLIDRARPLAARAAAVARDAARTATGGSTPFRSSPDSDDPSGQPASTAARIDRIDRSRTGHGRRRWETCRHTQGIDRRRRKAAPPRQEDGRESGIETKSGDEDGSGDDVEGSDEDETGDEGGNPDGTGLDREARPNRGCAEARRDEEARVAAPTRCAQPPREPESPHRDPGLARHQISA